MGLWTLKNNKILVIDDFAEMRSMLRSMLRAYGAEDIAQASNGEEAVEQIANQKFDIILCDYNLGEGKDGQQVLEECKHRDILPLATTFIMVTAENTSKMVMGALDYQPDAYLAKPITKTTLQTRLKKILDKKEFTKKISVASDRREYDRAIRLCDEEMENHPNLKLELQSLKFGLLIRTGDFPAAEAVCNEVLEGRDIPWARLGLAKCCYEQQRYSEAQQLLEEIIAENSDFIAAYDLLGQTLKQLGDLHGAEEAIGQAVERSPKSLMRQRELGSLATKNENHTIAERARRDAVKIGKNSVLKLPDDYVNYSQSLIKNNKSKEALKVAGNIRHVFKGNHEAKMQAELCKSDVYSEMGDESRAQKAVEAALELHKKSGAPASSSASIVLAKGCLKYGFQDEADELISEVAKNHHGESEVLEELIEACREVGQGGEVEEKIAQAVSEIAEINNNGVRLINEGKIVESIELFRKAAQALPQNHIINLNAAESCIMLMEKEGRDIKMVNEAVRYLNAVKGVEAAEEKYDALLNRCRALS